MDEKQVVTIELDAPAVQRIERAARLTNQVPGAFLSRAVEAVTRQVLLEDAAERWLREEATYSELAAETGLWIEEIMQAVARRNGDRAVDTSLQDWQALAEEHQQPDLLRLAQAATDAVRDSTR
jgi:predicted transcriptional regulator